MGLDPLALVALVVSLVALLVAFMQVAQQYAATAYDYRRCSERVIGGWAKDTHRRWIWKEVRFEVLFSTPRITCEPPLSPAFEPENDTVTDETYRRADSTTLAKYCFVAALNQRGVSWRKPWFLDGKKAVPEGKCSWLTLLGDTMFTDARFTIEKISSSFDFVPPGITIPQASAERNSFLTLMSLFGIKWKNRGDDGELTGAGDFCEITFNSSLTLRKFYVYRRQVDNVSGRPLPVNQKYYLLSERARKAMFHCFDLGFVTFKTHTDIEIKTSMKDPGLGLDEETVNRVVGLYNGANQWCSGLSESITCWAAQSMPKVVDKEHDKFKSMFSAISAISLTTGKPAFVRILVGEVTSRNTIPSVRELTDWANRYWTWDGFNSPLDMKNVVLEGLRYAAAHDVYQNISDLDIPWRMSYKCLEGIRLLDSDLENRLLRHFEESDRKKIKVSISNKQITYGSKLSIDAAAAANSVPNGYWVNELDQIGARNYVQVASDITAEVTKDITGAIRNDPVLAQMIVVNRLMRGSLWVIHNGNAPDQAGRSLECSLSSTWLSDRSTVYIS